MEFEQIKKSIYYTDNGIFRNIYSCNLKLNDWNKWIDVVNSNFKLDFKSYKTNESKDKIVFEDIKKFWDGIDLDGFMASIFINDFQINCFFNGINDFEADIDALEILNEDQHKSIINFMIITSKCFDKSVFLEHDFTDSEEKRILEVKSDYIKYF